MIAVLKNPSTLSAFLYPKTIAVIGASSAPRKAGGRRWLSIIGQGFTGTIVPVNSRATELGEFKTVKSVQDIKGGADLAVVMVPTPAVLDVVRDCIEGGVRGIVMVSAGFGETGEEGQRAEAEMVAMCRAAGTRLLGPNSAGVFSAAGNVNTVGWKIPSGRIAVVTQSGNMAGTFTHYARAKSAGFSSLIAVGNSADIKLSELVEMLLEDQQTNAILVYCEGFAPGDGRALVNVMRSANRCLPVILLKPGVSEAGKQAAKSHTGSLAGEDAVVSAALAEAGILRASEAEEAFDLAVALSACPPMRGNRIVVLSDGGGHATIVSDCAGHNGLTLAELSGDTKKQLSEILPDRSGIENPVDFAGLAESNPDCTAKVLNICLRDENVDGVIFAGHFGGYHLMTDDPATQESIAKFESDAASEIARSAAELKKPVILHSDHGEKPLHTLDPIRKANIPLYSGLEAGAKAMAALRRWNAIEQSRGKSSDKPATYAVSERAIGLSTHVLTEVDARKRLSAFSVDVPEFQVVQSASEAIAAFRSFGRPVAMKLMSTKLVHKSDSGGVLLNLGSESQIESSWASLEKLSRTLGDGETQILITPMIASGIECIIGAKYDAQFGPLVLFGAGGVLVELTKDSAISLAPITTERAHEAIEKSMAGKLLRGFRGSAPIPTEPLAKLLVAVSNFIANQPDVIEVDLNPVIVNAAGAHIADARLVVT